MPPRTRSTRRWALLLPLMGGLAALPARGDTPLGPRASWSGKVGFFVSGVPLAVDTASDTDHDVDAFAQPAQLLVAPSSIPAGARLVQAFLYWAGSINGTGCAGYTLDRDVDLTPPGWTGAPVRVLADGCECSVGARSYDIQACHADVTGLVNAAGGSMTGPWMIDGFIAKVTNAPTDNASASLVLVYASPTLRPRRIALYDGLLTMASNSTTLRLDGLQVDDPPRGDLTWYVLEGDAGGGSGEQVTARGRPGGRTLVLADAVNPADDPMNGTINTVSPPLTGLGGVDVDRFSISGALAANDTSLETTYTAALDKWWLVFNMVGVDVFEAALGERSAMLVDLAVDADGNGKPSPGDTVRYTVHLVNDGSGAGAVALRAAIPSEAARWHVSDTGGGTDASTGSTFALDAVPVAVGGATDASFELVLADVPDRTEVHASASFDARPHGDTGTLLAPPLLVRRDGDHDGIFDQDDDCPTAANPDQADADGDGVGDACDVCAHDATNDADHDTICEDVDNCPGEPNPEQRDRDRDGKGDACDRCPDDATNDADHDGVCQDADDCPGIANPGQEDADHDGVGDACDPCPQDTKNDPDADGVCDAVDDCPAAANPGQEDADKDGVGDACDRCPHDEKNDEDGDGVCGDVDDCAEVANADQKDSDHDGVGDACDACPLDEKNDFDRDGVCADVDDCPTQFDPKQADRDRDGIGDACDTCPDDPTNTIDDAGRCANEHLDKLKESGCGCGAADPGAVLSLLGLLAAGCRRRRRGRGDRRAGVLT